MSREAKVRVRFAPSPTGLLHIGGVRTALFNYLFAKHMGGTMVLRIEDTDTKRFVPGAEEYIVESLRWLGIAIDEGVGTSAGEFGPYRQSERSDIYREYVDRLLQCGHAYYAFDTPEELEKARERDPNFSYDAASRMGMRNGLTLGAQEAQRLVDAGEQYVVRFKVEADRDVELNDLIRGRVVINSSQVDDKVLYKSSDGLPTYHLANVVDDHLMEITHVIRGEEWLASSPLHVLLYEAFGWHDTMPQFAHLPLILKPVGSGKLSKRDGDKFGFPVFPLGWKDPQGGEMVMGYREQGYLPEAVVNFLALLGWNPGTDQELFSMEELIGAFTLERCSKGGARFDYNKAKWFNHQYVQRAEPEVLMAWVRPLLAERGLKVDEGRLKETVETVRDKVQLLTDLLPEVLYLFEAPEAYDPQGVKKHWKAESPEYVRRMADALEDLPEAATGEEVEQRLYATIEAEGLPMGKVMNSLRMALVGAPRGAKIHEIIHLLGIKETVRRLRYAAEHVAMG